MAKGTFLALVGLTLNGFAVANIHDLPGHEWVKAGPGDSRSPCPGLNVLANHGFLPHNGQNITKAMLKTNIMKVYNLDDQLAEIFADSGVKVLDPKATHIQLSDLDKHDSIEHDASLTREDARTGDNHSLNQRLFDALLADAPGEFLDVQTLATSRNRRKRESEEGGSPTLNAKMRTLAYGESALILQALGKLANQTELRPPKDAVRQWIGQERLPNNWQRPDPMTLGSTTGLSGKVLLAANVQEPPNLIEGVLDGAAGLLGLPAKLLNIVPRKRAEPVYHGHGMWA